MKKKWFIIFLISSIFCIITIIYTTEKNKYNNLKDNVMQVDTTNPDNIMNNYNETNNKSNDYNNKSEDKISVTKETISNYKKASDTIVARIYGKVIREKDLCITKFFYPNSDNLVNQEIENEVLEKLAKENNLTISEKEQDYINQTIKELGNDIANSNNELFIESNISEDEYLQLLKNYLEKITLKNEYKKLIRSQIDNGTLETKDLNLKEEYMDYYYKYKEWDQEKDIMEYKNISDYKEKILQKYITYQINQAQPEIY